LSTPSNVAGAGEHALIERIRRRLPAAPPWVVVGVGDDAAVVEPVRNTMDVFTADALVEGVHFDRAFTPPSAIGHRALAVNLSDLAAMGAEPRVALLSLALPASLPVADLEAIVDGLLGLAARHQVHLVGGNITRSPGPLVLDVTAVGSVRRRRVLTRAGARPGDEVWVSGALGAAAAGLAMLQAGPVPADTEAQACAAAYLTPEPRVRLGTLLGRNRAATSCIDLSDGLADGAAQLAAASGVGLVLDAGALPVPEAARRWWAARGDDAVTRATGGGDDYELLFTVSRRRRSRFTHVRRLAGGLPLTRIGRVTDDRQVRLEREGVSAPLAAGYEHFR
jgi:thiamine-monophosphate kinase